MKVLTDAVALPTDSLRPPSPLDLRAHAYKDWLHVNVFEPRTGVTAIVNVSLHGDPLVPSSLAVGTVVVHGGDGRLDAIVDVRPRHDASVSIRGSSIAVGGVAEVALGEGAFLRASGRTGETELDVIGWPATEPIDVERPMPFGSGWIAWRAVPRLDIDGWMRVGSVERRLDGAVGYHDHNWGRWCWGDDIGWRWGTFPAADDNVSLTVAHRTGRHHRDGQTLLRAQAGAIIRDYPGRTVSIEYAGRGPVPRRRLPGAMAALRSDRQRPDLPARVCVRVADGFDRLTVELDVDDAVQLVTSDPARPGQTFIHELFGRFTIVGRVGGRPITASGLGVFEHVD